MGNYKHILFAADLDPKDDEAIADKALQIAKAFGAKLSLIHVVDFVYNYGLPDGTSKVHEWQEELETQAREQLKKLGDRVGVPEERQILPIGRPKDMILKAADKNDVDLIVVGSHGRHGLTEFFLGSTSNDVVHDAKCDILAIRIPEKS